MVTKKSEKNATQNARDVTAAIKCMIEAEKLHISQAGSYDPTWGPRNREINASIAKLEAEALKLLRSIATRKMFEK